MSEFKDITCEEYLELKDQSDFFLVKSPMLNPEKLPGTDLVLDDYDLDQYLEDLPSDKDKSILVYCNRGYVSRHVAQALIQLGYENVYNLIRGVRGWKELNKDIEL